MERGLGGDREEGGREGVLEREGTQREREGGKERERESYTLYTSTHTK